MLGKLFVFGALVLVTVCEAVGTPEIPSVAYSGSTLMAVIPQTTQTPKADDDDCFR